ncbi:hypothetical protein HY229_00840 [Candidatus Acetothermia bacterium]|nr:hypothetical protein [Candidatus Acetothermia bacterium]MBI3642637.1 hypothetical protein [Candidatus Acetothermia bacterium]
MRLVQKPLWLLITAGLAFVAVAPNALAIDATLSCSGVVELVSAMTCSITFKDFPQAAQSRVLISTDPDWSQTDPTAPLLTVESLLYPDGRSQRVVSLRIMPHTQTRPGTYKTEIVIIYLSFAGDAQTVQTRLPLTVRVPSVEGPSQPPQTGTGKPPKIDSVSIDGKTLFANDPFEWSLGYEDPDQDVAEVRFQTRVSSDSIIWLDAGSYDPHAQGQPTGTLPITTICNQAGTLYRRVLLKDAAGNSSEPFEYHFKCEFARAKIDVAGNSVVHTKEGVDLKAAAGMPLRDGDTLTATNNCTLELENGDILEIGSRITQPQPVKTVLILNGPTSASQWSSVKSIGLQEGNFYYYHVSGSDPKTSDEFQIKTPYFVANPSGASFFVTHDPQAKLSSIGVVNGTIRVTSNTPSSPTLILKSSQQVAVSPTGTSLVTSIGSGNTPSGSPSTLKDFDKNNNNKLDDSEFFAIVDVWIGGKITDKFFFSAVDHWVANQPIATAAGLIPQSYDRRFELMTTHSAKQFGIVVRGSGLQSIHVQIFDLKGREIFDQQAFGSRLSFNLTSHQNGLLANGTYLCIITGIGSDGFHLISEVKKLVVLR